MTRRPAHPIALRTDMGSVAIFSRRQPFSACGSTYAASALNCSASDPVASERTCPLRIMCTSSSPVDTAARRLIHSPPRLDPLHSFSGAERRAREH
jgi:hypothetical protein